MRLLLLSRFGRLCSKVFKKSVFESNDLKYPEFCLFEDNPLTFVLPLLVGKFVICEEVGYLHDESFDSVTRGKRSGRYFDRIWTSLLGYQAGISITDQLDSDYGEVIKEKFCKLFLWNTRSVFLSGPKAWAQRARVFKLFRSKCEPLTINYHESVSAYRHSMGIRGRLLFELVWAISFCLPEQENYFRLKYRSEWGRDFDSQGFVDLLRAKSVAVEIARLEEVHS